MRPLLLLIEHQAEHIEAELRVLETHAPKLALGFMTQHMASRRPKRSNRLPNGLVIRQRVAIDISCKFNLTARGAVYPVDLALRKGLEGVDTQFLRKRVYARVSEELVARLVEFGDCRIGFEAVWRGRAAREVFAGVLVLEEGRYSLYGFVLEGNAALYQRNRSSISFYART